MIDDGFEVRFRLASTLGFESQPIIKSIQDDLRALHTTLFQFDLVPISLSLKHLEIKFREGV